MKLLKIIILLLTIIPVSSYGGEVKIDGSSTETCQKTSKEIMKSLTDDESNKLDEGLEFLWEMVQFAAELHGKSDEEAMSALCSEIDGMSHKEIVELSVTTKKQLEKEFSQ